MRAALHVEHAETKHQVRVAGFGRERVLVQVARIAEAARHMVGRCERKHFRVFHRWPVLDEQLPRAGREGRKSSDDSKPIRGAGYRVFQVSGG
ncbi:hypothetical protein BGC_24250 [Burkholderia sp. 3C]